MQTLHDISTDDSGKRDTALSMLVRLLARQVAREWLAASESSTLSAPDSTAPIPSPTDAGERQDG